jgi:ribose transport system substrate-binding protein
MPLAVPPDSAMNVVANWGQCRFSAPSLLGEPEIATCVRRFPPIKVSSMFYQISRYTRLGVLLGLVAGFATQILAIEPTSPQPKATKRIILLNNTDSPFWDAARAGIKKAEEDLKLADAGYSASMDTNDGTDRGQIEKLRQYGLQKDIAAVIISPINAGNPQIAEQMRALKKKGILVGCFDSDMVARAADAREFYIGTNNIQGGKVLGTAVKNLKPEGGEYAQFVGKDSQQNAIERMDGFTEAVGKKVFTEKGRRVDETDRNRARENVRDMVVRQKNLSILVGIWSYNAPAIVDVVKEKNLREKFTIATFDAEPSAIQQMSDGMIDVMVVQNPFGMGSESVRYAFAKLTNDAATVKSMFPKMGEKGGDILDTGLKVVVPDKQDRLKAEMFSEFGNKVEFLKLSEFQAWLKKYNLTSS